MLSVLNEVTKLRSGSPFDIDYHNSNRYRLVVQEDDGSKTAYYFSTPIYNRKSRKMIDVKFQSSGGTIYLTGSDANITVSDNILMANAEGYCTIGLPQRCSLVSENEAQCGNICVVPTTNGVALKCAAKDSEGVAFIVDVGEPFLNIRANDKYFALMKKRFRPFVVFSCVGSIDATGNVIAPAKIEYQKLTDNRYRIAISATSPLAQYIIFEANLYENKLFQDTTVESMNPSTNNAFGGVGFIGNTSLYGEQWLYSRLDYSRISEVIDKRIHKVTLHMPKLNQSHVELNAFKVNARFCSFGSNWNNKISDGIQVSDSLTTNEYQSLDITPLLVEPRTRTILRSDGLILKSKIRGSGFSVIATGDSSFAPQILEVNYR